jgi:hypothetical protein
MRLRDFMPAVVAGAVCAILLGAALVVFGAKQERFRYQCRAAGNVTQRVTHLPGRGGPILLCKTFDGRIVGEWSLP